MRILVVLLLVAMIVGCGKIHGTYALSQKE